MMTKLYYMVSNDGAGGAGVTFYPSRELATFVDDNQEEGFGESTVGYVEIPDCDVRQIPGIQNVETVAYELFNYGCEYLEDMVKKFITDKHFIIEEFKRDGCWVDISFTNGSQMRVFEYTKKYPQEAFNSDFNEIKNYINV